MAEVEFTRSALLAIHQETMKAGASETGGTLFGKETTDGSFIVLEATGPGPGHAASSLHFSPDHAFQTRKIEEAEAKGLQYLGEWHKHPPHFRRLSNGDMAAFRAIMLKNPQLDRVLAVLTFLEDGTVNLGAYVMEKNGGIHIAKSIGGYEG